MTKESLKSVLGNEEKLFYYPGMVDMSLTTGASGGRVGAAPQGQLGRPQPTGGPLPPLPQQQQPQQTWFEPARGNSNTGGTGIWAGGKSTTYNCWRVLCGSCINYGFTNGMVYS